ncbi:MAG: hypothetical protein U0457_12225 [Candidatus Sericytochromatia bacterium]
MKKKILIFTIIILSSCSYNSEFFVGSKDRDSHLKDGKGENTSFLGVPSAPKNISNLTGDIDKDGNLYINDYDRYIRKITPQSNLITLNKECGYSDKCIYLDKDNKEGKVYYIQDIFVDKENTILFNSYSRLIKINKDNKFELYRNTKNSPDNLCGIDNEDNIYYLSKHGNIELIKEDKNNNTINLLEKYKDKEFLDIFFDSSYKPSEYRIHYCRLDKNSNNIILYSLGEEEYFDINEFLPNIVGGYKSYLVSQKTFIIDQKNNKLTKFPYPTYPIFDSNKNAYFLIRNYPYYLKSERPGLIVYYALFKAEEKNNYKNPKEIANIQYYGDPAQVRGFTPPLVLDEKRKTIYVLPLETPQIYKVKINQ